MEPFALGAVCHGVDLGERDSGVAAHRLGECLGGLGPLLGGLRGGLRGGLGGRLGGGLRARVLAVVVLVTRGACGDLEQVDGVRCEEHGRRGRPVPRVERVHREPGLELDDDLACGERHRPGRLVSPGHAVRRRDPGRRTLPARAHRVCRPGPDGAGGRVRRPVDGRGGRRRSGEPGRGDAQRHRPCRRARDGRAGGKRDREDGGDRDDRQAPSVAAVVRVIDAAITSPSTSVRERRPRRRAPSGTDAGRMP